MKKLILFAAVCLCTAGVFAQSAADLKNAGNEALRSKKYKVAIEKYEAYMNAPDTEKDIPLVYNTAICAYKIKNYAKAEKYFTKSIENKYKLSKAYYYCALMQKKQNKFDAMVTTLNQGIEACKGKNSKLVKALSKHYLIAGQKAQKAKKFAKAEELYKKASERKSKLQVDAFASLGTMYYNQGAEIMQKATPIANKEPEKYKAESVKAKGYYQKALNILQKAKQLAPTRKDILTTLSTVKKLLK